MARRALALVVMAACTGGEDDASVVGDWRVVEHAFFDYGDGPIIPSVWSFRADGTVAFDDAEGGTYQVDGDRMSLRLIDEEEELTIDSGFVVTDDRLLFGALFPEGEAHGAVGTWSSDWIFDGQVNPRSLTLDADGRASFDDIDDHAAGTWDEDGESLLLDLDVGYDYLFRIDERGIGDWLGERI